MRLDDLRKKALERPELRKEIGRFDLRFELGQLLLKAKLEIARFKVWVQSRPCRLSHSDHHFGFKSDYCVRCGIHIDDARDAIISSKYDKK